MKIAIGADVGGTAVKLGSFSESGELLKKWDIKTDVSEHGKNIIPDIAKSIKAMVSSEGYELTGVGMGVPGPVAEDGHIPTCVNLGWKDCYPARELSELLGGTKVNLENDANAAALGESWMGGAKGARDAFLFTLGTGIGGGLILGGKIRRGRTGICGEVGHMHITDEIHEVCNCGCIGCLEQVASATGIVRVAKMVLASSDEPSVLRDVADRLSAKMVCDGAKAGDRLAMQSLEKSCAYLGLAMSHVSLAVEPDTFVLGGGVSKAGDILIELSRKYYERYIKFTVKRADIVLATLGNDAGIYGAVRSLI